MTGEAPFCSYMGGLPDFLWEKMEKTAQMVFITGKMKGELRKKSTFHGAGVV